MKAAINTVKGFSYPEFEPVAAAFRAQAERGEPGGSSVSIFKDGTEVLNLWQGFATSELPWQQNTVSNVFSCSKGIVSVVCAMLVSQGLLDLEETVAHYWPDFAQNGKQDIKVKTALQHRAGLSAPRRSLSHEQATDGHSLAAEIAAQEPLWQPGSTWGYHALTFGTIASKVIEGATGLTVGQYLAKHVTRALDVDLWIGLAAGAFNQLAPLISDQNFKPNGAAEYSDAYWQERAMTLGGALPTDPTDINGFNDPETLAAELPGANGVTNAHGLAKLFSAAVVETSGIKLADDEVLKMMCVPASTGSNAWNEPAPNPVWGTGFLLRVPGFIEAPGEDGFGHNGLGGQAAWASLKHRVSFGYTTSFLKNSSETQRNQKELVDALNLVIGSV